MLAVLLTHTLYGVLRFWSPSLESRPLCADCGVFGQNFFLKCIPLYFMCLLYSPHGERKMNLPLIHSS